MAGFIVDAREAERLAEEIAVRNVILLEKVHTQTLAAGRRIQALARSGAPRTPHTKGFAASFYTKTNRYASGTSVAIETKNKLGAIIVFGTSRAGPHRNVTTGEHDSPGAALDEVQPSWEAAIMGACEGVI